MDVLAILKALASGVYDPGALEAGAKVILANLEDLERRTTSGYPFEVFTGVQAGNDLGHLALPSRSKRIFEDREDLFALMGRRRDQTNPNLVIRSVLIPIEIENVAVAPYRTSDEILRADRLRYSIAHQVVEPLLKHGKEYLAEGVVSPSEMFDQSSKQMARFGYELALLEFKEAACTVLRLYNVTIPEGLR